MTTNQREFSFNGYLREGYESLPAFTDVFDEEGFYLAFIGVALTSILVAIIASRFITIKEADI